MALRLQCFFPMVMLFALLFSLMSSGQDIPWADIPSPYKEMHGKTFEGQGPNCFATALKMTGRVPSFRYVDGREFELYTQLACTETVSPQLGDIGVYSFKDGFSLIHAFVYLNETYGFEKEGADQVGSGRSPLEVRTHSVIAAIHGSDSFCRQYSSNDPVCYYHLRYERCQNLNFSQWPWAQSMIFELEQNEKQMEILLESSNMGSKERALHEISFKPIKRAFSVSAQSGLRLWPRSL